MCLLALAINHCWFADRWFTLFPRTCPCSREAVQWVYYGYLGAVREQDGAAMSMVSCNSAVEPENNSRHGELADHCQRSFCPIGVRCALNARCLAQSVADRCVPLLCKPQGRIDAFLDTYFEKDLASGAITESQAQELIDQFVQKMRIVRCD